MAERSRVRNWSEYMLVQTLRLCFLLFPINVNLQSAKVIGWLWAKLMPRIYQRAVDNLTMAFGAECSAEEIRRLALRSMQNFAMTGVELMQSPQQVDRCADRAYRDIVALGPAAVPALIGLTEHPEAWTRRNAVLALKVIDPPSAWTIVSTLRIVLPFTRKSPPLVS